MTTKDQNLRSKIIDLIKHIRSIPNFEYSILRHRDRNRFLERLGVTHADVSVSDLLEICKRHQVKPEFVVVTSEGDVDCDGYSEEWLVIYEKVVESDVDYFEGLCNYVIPSYDYRRYKDWYSLKKEFEPS